MSLSEHKSTKVKESLWEAMTGRAIMSLWPLSDCDKRTSCSKHHGDLWQPFPSPPQEPTFSLKGRSFILVIKDSPPMTVDDVHVVVQLKRLGPEWIWVRTRDHWLMEGNIRNYEHLPTSASYFDYGVVYPDDRWVWISVPHRPRLFWRDFSPIPWLR